jgi:hypothetical protein
MGFFESQVQGKGRQIDDNIKFLETGEFGYGDHKFEFNTPSPIGLDFGGNFDFNTGEASGGYTFNFNSGTESDNEKTPQAQPQTEMIPQSGLPALPPTGTDPTHGAAQMYGAARGGGSRRHAGQDFDAGPNDTFYSRIGGEVIYSANAGGGYGNVVDVYNKELGVTERIAEGDSNLVSIGDIIKPGTPVQKGTAQTGVFHYEIRKGRAGASGSFSGTVDPIEFLKNLPTKTKVEPVSQSPPNKAQEVSSTASYEETGTQVAMIQVPLPVPMPLPGGGGGASSGGSRSSGGIDIDSIILGQSFSNA